VGETRRLLPLSGSPKGARSAPEHPSGEPGTSLSGWLFAPSHLPMTWWRRRSPAFEFGRPRMLPLGFSLLVVQLSTRLFCSTLARSELLTPKHREQAQIIRDHPSSTHRQLLVLFLQCQPHAVSHPPDSALLQLALLVSPFKSSSPQPYPQIVQLTSSTQFYLLRKMKAMMLVPFMKHWET